MKRSTDAPPICCFPSALQLGPTCSCARWLQSSCSVRHRSLRTTPIIVKARAVRITSIFVVLPLLAAAAAPVLPVAVPLDQQLRQARSEQAAAEKEAARLEQSAAKARGEVERLRAEQAASAQNIEAAEARITAADMQLRLASAYVAAHRQQLAGEQRPISSLLAGLAVMGRRPPLLAIADQSSADELVKVRILLDATLPVIRARTAKLSV